MNNERVASLWFEKDDTGNITSTFISLKTKYIDNAIT